MGFCRTTLGVFALTVGILLTIYISTALRDGRAVAEPLGVVKVSAGAPRPVTVWPSVMGRAKSMTGYAPAPIRVGRGVGAVGDPCSCDADCAPLTDSGGCMLAQCIRATEASGATNIDGTCQILQQVADTRCETDGDPCTVGRCKNDGTCNDGPALSSPCAKECTGTGNDAGQNCCDEPTGCYSCTPPDTNCENKDRVTCVNDGGRANCQVDGSDVLVGRCCDPTNTVAGQYTTLADCDGGRTWLELTDPDDQMHLPVRCPAYSSGIVNGNTSNDAAAVYPIVPPPFECGMKNDDSNYGAYCEIDADCAHRCQGDNDVVCVVSADCDVVGGPCLPDTCVDVVGPGRCDGSYAIGDDYTIEIPAGRALRLQEIRFRGGGERQLEVLVFDFYDKSSGSPVRTGSVGMRVAQGGIYTYTIERDCDPNCDWSQFCNPPNPQCECLPRPDGCIADPPFIVPADGYMVMRSGRAQVTAEGPDDLNGSWVPVDMTARAGVEVGVNDPNVMWVDDGPIGVGNAGPLPEGARVLAFEIVGRLIDDPVGACCEPATGNCENTNRWECRFCSGTGMNAGVVCDRGGANWGGIDRDCTEQGDQCVTANWRGPRTMPDYDDPWCHGGNNNPACTTDADCGGGECYDGEKCIQDDPCSDGTCCDAVGYCATGGPGDCPDKHCRGNPAVTCADDAECVVGEIDFGPCIPMFQGYGTLCDAYDVNVANCCPQPVDAWGECCRDEYRCTGGLNLPCDPGDGGACDSGNDGTCELACEGPIIYDIEVPPWWFPAWEPTVIDLTTDSRRAEFNSADTCAYQTNDGWYTSFHIDSCAVVTFNFCCTDPQLQLVSQFLVNGCPCGGPVVYIAPDVGHSGFGDGCGNGHCCEDGNYSVQWTVRAGTYHYGVPAGIYCEQSGHPCLSSTDCPPGEACKNFKQQLQAHIIVEPCEPQACCNDAYPCVTADDCPPAPFIGPPECGIDNFCVEHCMWLSQFDCEDSGGDWLGWNPWGAEICQYSPCDYGACCTAEGSCEDDNGTGISPAACSALPEGDYHGGVRCADRPCATCEFNMIGPQIDHDHCQGDTGQYLFPSDRFQGTRRADDFRPQDSPIRSICFSFGFLTDESDECVDDPPQDDFHIRFYEDAFGFPETELPDSPGPVVIDRKEPIPAMRTWQFHATVGGAGGVEVSPGECYWLEITGMGDNECSTLWTHSEDGNNYGLRDDNMSYGPEDIRHNDVVWCIDTGIVAPTNPGTNGGCGDLPVACCTRDDTEPCVQTGSRACSDQGNFGFPYSVCGTFQCPDPPNDLCTSDPSGVGVPDMAAVVCTGDPAYPEWGEWRFWTGELGDRLGQCDDWPGAAGYGQVCDPQTQDCREPSTAVCMSHPNEAYECWFDGDNRLASTDGPLGGGACGNDNAFQADVWYKIAAPCRGRAVVTMCDGQWDYDGMLSVYGDATSDLLCPGPGYNDDELLECNDEYCIGSATASGVHWDAEKYAIYLLRQGGWSANGELLDAAQGRAQFHLGFFCECYVPYEPPELPANPVHRAPKHRYLSIDPSRHAPNSVAIKVELVSMKRCAGDLRRACLVDDDCPDVCENNNEFTCTDGDQCNGSACISTGPCGEHPDVGLSWFVQEPQTRGEGCPNGVCGDEDFYARLDADEVYSSDWSASSTLHIGDCQIVPAATYAIYYCDPVNPTICSDGSADEYCTPPLPPPLFATQPLPFNAPGTRGSYGDVVGPVTPDAKFAPPDGIANVVDLVGYVLTGQNWGTPNLPQAHPTWIDLHGLGAGNPPNYILNVSDLTQIMFGLQGIPWANGSGNLQPGECP